MKHRTSLLHILLILPLVAGSAFAESNKPVPSEFALGEVVVTSERLKEYVKNHPLDVKVVERSEIVERNLPNVEEILKTMPGVEVQSTSGTGTRISIRGSGRSSGVMVLLNGRPLNSNQYGSQDLNSIPVDMIQSISVFKPPVPVWIGPGGSDGAINIITRASKASEEKQKPRTTVKGSGGSYGYVDGGVSHLLPFEAGSTLLSLSGSHRDGRRVNSDKTDGAVTLNWNREVQGGSRFEANGRYYQSEFGSPGPTDNLTPDARQRYHKGSFDGRYTGLLGETGTIASTLYGDLFQLIERAQSGSKATMNDRKFGLKSDATWSDDGGNRDLRLGLMTEWDTYEHTLSGEHQRFRNGLSAQYDRRFGTVTATLGVRGDVSNDFGFNPGFSSGVGWGVTEKTLIKARAGYTVNVPAFEQLFQPTHGSVDQSRGNPDLKEERVWSYDLGLEHTFGKDRQIQLTLFRADTFDLITTRRGADLFYRPVNISWAQRQGVELSGKYAWESSLAIESSCIVQDSRNGDSGEKLPYTPTVKVKSTLYYTIPMIKTRLEGTFRYEGARLVQTETLPSQRLGEYVVIDIKATQPFFIGKTSLDSYVKIENLLDRRFQRNIGNVDDGIRVVAGAQMRF